MAKSALLLALDFGGTKLTAGLAVLGERGWQAHRLVPAPSNSNAQRDLETMMMLAQDMLATTGLPLAAVGVSFGGPVDAARGVVLLSHHVPGWENVPLRQWLETRFGVPAAVDNDANAGALGEWRFGAGRGRDSLLYVTVSTGIGGGWIVNGQPYRGAEGMAGEIGHVIVQPGGAECICGRRGCLEALAAGPAIARRARECLTENPATGQALRDLVGGDVSAVTARHVSQAAAAGDELAQQVLHEAARALGQGIGNAITLMNPQRVVVGGGVAKSGPRYFEVVRTAARANVLPGMTVDVVPAELGDDAPLWGGVALAGEMLNQSVDTFV
ncbi:MAG: ROK family protein [Chloroflexota bacterium]|nr:ROK family protein [Chloroflexota bacterium]